MRFRSWPAMIIAWQLMFPVVHGQLANGDDWPQWRGPHRDGTWREAGVVNSIPEWGLPIEMARPDSQWLVGTGSCRGAGVCHRS